jgi:hypothetical protein
MAKPTMATPWCLPYTNIHKTTITQRNRMSHDKIFSRRNRIHNITPNACFKLLQWPSLKKVTESWEMLKWFVSKGWHREREYKINLHPRHSKSSHQPQKTIINHCHQHKWQGIDILNHTGILTHKCRVVVLDGNAANYGTSPANTWQKHKGYRWAITKPQQSLHAS